MAYTVITEVFLDRIINPSYFEATKGLL